MNHKTRAPRRAMRGLLLAALGLASGLAAAQAAPAVADRQTRVWAAACAACHGSEGRSPGAIPAIAGRDAATLHRTLLEFKNNQRPAATVMHQHTKGYTDDELLRIAQFYAAQPAR